MEQPDDKTPLKRFVDVRIPLYWVLTILGGFVWAQVSAWFSLQALTGQVAELTAATKIQAQAYQDVQSKLALIEFRLGNLEYNAGIDRQLPAQGAPHEAHR